MLRKETRFFSSLVSFETLCCKAVVVYDKSVIVYDKWMIVYDKFTSVYDKSATVYEKFLRDPYTQDEWCSYDTYMRNCWKTYD